MTLFRLYSFRIAGCHKLGIRLLNLTCKLINQLKHTLKIGDTRTGRLLIDSSAIRRLQQFHKLNFSFILYRNSNIEN